MSDATILLMASLSFGGAAVLFLALFLHAQREQWKREDQIAEEAFERGFSQGIQHERNRKL
jgi:hypothetical protein